ncbi:MAG: TAXI family TRAP transporter solute-binding subunit [Alphaproteobacteria bacterium]|nr:MAG: TAXI family TRAP transporter solute-binding subunit [Alphaproteobacteria bacterium]
MVALPVGGEESMRLALSGSSGSKTVRTAVAALVLGLCAWIPPSAADLRFQEAPIILATGNRGGTYFVAGQRLCQMINRARQMLSVRCQGEVTAGSAVNMELLGARKVDFAIVQGDAVAPGAMPWARFIMGLHVEHLAVMVRADDRAGTLADLVTRRVDIGVPGSGSRRSAESLYAALGLTLVDPVGLHALVRAEGLCSRAVDAVLFLQGTPAAPLLEAAERCDVRVLPVSRAVAARVMAALPAWSEASVPGGLYRGIVDDVPVLGMQALVVAHEEVSVQAVRALWSVVKADLDFLREAHPSLRALKLEAMQAIPTGIPPHAGVR